MIPFEKALHEVLQQSLKLGDELVALTDSADRILAEDIKADRDFPPFDRATKDGIAINFKAIEEGISRFKIEGVLSAGMRQQTLSSSHNCFEIMTGAVVPKMTDTVIMYEDLTIADGYAVRSKLPTKGQDIHRQGSDEKKGNVLLGIGTRIGAAEIGVLASVGKSQVLVMKLPKACIISTGDELVEVSEIPLPHQIRKSNSISMFAAVSKEKINARMLHLSDDKKSIEKGLKVALEENDVLLLSGGVSKGKFDYIPEVMASLGVENVFHGVSQRPGKPFWFGVHPKLKTVVFSFPGNPVSTFANYHVYFLPWLQKTVGEAPEPRTVLLDSEVVPNPKLTLFVQVQTFWKSSRLFAIPIPGNGSGDLTSLSKSDGFICLKPRTEIYEKGEAVPFIKTK